MGKTYIKQLDGKTVEKEFSDAVVKKLGGRKMNGWEPKSSSKPTEIKSPPEPPKGAETNLLKADYQARYTELYGHEPASKLTVEGLKQAITDKELEIEEANK